MIHIYIQKHNTHYIKGQKKQEYDKNYLPEILYSLQNTINL